MERGDHLKTYMFFIDLIGVRVIVGKKNQQDMQDVQDAQDIKPRSFCQSCASCFVKILSAGHSQSE